MRKVPRARIGDQPIQRQPPSRRRPNNRQERRGQGRQRPAGTQGRPLAESAPAARSAGTSPARTSEDLPLPDGPSTARKRVRLSFSSSRWTPPRGRRRTRRARRRRPRGRGRDRRRRFSKGDRLGAERDPLDRVQRARPAEHACPRSRAGSPPMSGRAGNAAGGLGRNGSRTPGSSTGKTRGPPRSFAGAVDRQRDLLHLPVAEVVRADEDRARKDAPRSRSPELSCHPAPPGTSAPLIKPRLEARAPAQALGDPLHPCPYHDCYARGRRRTAARRHVPTGTADRLWNRTRRPPDGERGPGIRPRWTRSLKPGDSLLESVRLGPRLLHGLPQGRHPLRVLLRDQALDAHGEQGVSASAPACGPARARTKYFLVPQRLAGRPVRSPVLLILIQLLKVASAVAAPDGTNNPNEIAMPRVLVEVALNRAPTRS